jgi:hypothetical protein
LLITRTDIERTDIRVLAFIGMASIAFQIRSTLVFCKIGDGYGQDAPIEYSSGAGKYCNDVVPSDHAFAFIEQYPSS